MKKPFLALIFLIAAFLAAIPAEACEPCAEAMTLEETAAEADLIIVGAMVGEGPSTGDGPDWITVQVLETWKGSTDRTNIRVNSWDGMCLYGIPNEEGTYLMLLEESDDQYVTVNYGCAISRYTLDPANEQVIVGDQRVSYNDFIDQLGPRAQRIKVSELETPVPPPPAWLMILIGVASLIGVAAMIALVVVNLRHRANRSDSTEAS